jgi:predicted SAM-dependent methyltransferase
MIGHLSRALTRGSRVLASGSRWLDGHSKRRAHDGELISQCPTKLNIGCGYDKREGYLNVDVDPACAPDLLIVDGDYSAIPRQHFSEVLAKDVLEHVPRAQTLDALLDFADYLVDGGKLIVQTTSILHVASKLRATDRYADHHSWTICLFGNQAHPGDFHFTGFTEVTLRVHLLAAGFTIEVLELREEWMPYVEAKKVFDWTSIVESSRSFSDVEFLQRAYQAAFHRDADETGIRHYGRELHKGVPRKQVLKQIFSAPETLFRTADENEVKLQRVLQL